MRKVFIVHGMKRSGNHAIINWLRAHGHFIFFNNIIPVAPILEGEASMPPPQDFEKWLRRQLTFGRIPFTGRLARFVRRNHALMVSLEDHQLSVRPFLDLPRDVTNVLILRDPVNLFASRIRKAFLLDHPAYPRENGAAMGRVIELWKSHAREFLGLTNQLGNRVSVSFNAWFSSEDYRTSLGEALGLAASGEAFAGVADTGGGSSFDGTLMDGQSQSMDVLDRRSRLSERERAVLENVLLDGELGDLARRTAGCCHGCRH